MPAAHRHGDDRECNATTVVEGQSTVFVNGQLWAVETDPNTHGNGDLISSLASTVFIEGKKCIVVGDEASADNRCPDDGEPHCTPGADEGSGDTSAGNG